MCTSTTISCMLPRMSPALVRLVLESVRIGRIFSALILVAIFGIPCELGAQDTEVFTRELFTYGRQAEVERDPSQALSRTDVALLKGDGYAHVTPMDGVKYIDFAWKRVGIVRAIGYQKQTQWVPTLIDEIDKIYWPKSSVQPPEVIYPCAWALAQIGEPSVEPVLKAIASSANSHRRGLLVLTLRGIRGEVGASQLLEDRGINVDKPIGGPSRPSKHGVNGGRGVEAQNVSESSDKSGGDGNTFIGYGPAIVWVVIVLILVIGAPVIWNITRKTRIRR